MDIEKMIEQLRYLADTPSYTAFHDAKEREIICDQCEADFCYDKQQDAHWCMYEALSRAATALSTLQAENERLRKELEYEREHANAYHEECGQWEAENEKLRAELERMKGIMRYNGIMVIPSKYPGGRSEWNIPKPRGQKED